MEPLLIVVLNWNTSELLNGALGSILDTAQGIPFSITVIDNASSDGGLSKVSERFRKDPRFSFIQNEKNIGWAAINIMLHKEGNYILTLDADARLVKGTLERMVAFMDTHSHAGAATAKLLNPDSSPQHYYRRILTPSLYFFTTPLGRFFDKYLFGLRFFNRYHYEDLELKRISEVEQPAWPCLMWRREALGAYIADPDIPFYFVDVDMSARLYARGYRIYLLPDAAVTHLKSASFGRANEAWKRREFYRSLAAYFRKHYPLWLPLLLPLIWLDRLLRALLLATVGREPLR